MADIKCQKCGKINPSFADVCLGCQAPLTPPPAASDSVEDETPEWLKRIRERTQEEPDARSAFDTPVIPMSEEELPDWLKELKEEKINKEIPPPAEENEQGNWLERLRTSPVYVREKPCADEKHDPDGEQETDNSGQVSPESESGVQLEEKEPGQAAPQDGFDFLDAEEAAPDDATIPVTPLGSKLNPFASAPEPARSRSDEPEADFPDAPPGSADSPAQEPLPFLPGAYEEKIAGLNNPEMAGFFQASALTNRVQLSEKQRLNISLLKEMIAGESEPRPVPAPPSRKANRFGRPVFLLTVLLVLLGVVVLAPYPAAMPQLYPVEVAALFNQISSLPENAPVLVAVDYDPSLAGEMQLAAGGFIGHLMARNARMALISTRPVGPMLAQSLVQAALPGQPRYSPGDHIVNLGYIPGDAAGLRSFVRRPGGFAAYSSDLTLAWDSPALQGVSLVGDFAAVVVITDSAEVIRNWIEQVQPALGARPLYVVLSAQAGPLIQPYFDSGQVQGGLSGLSGGAMYSQILGRTGFANPYMNALQVGAFLAVLAILGGGLANLLAYLVKSRSQGKEA